jgi:cytochrome c oxidase cbb3-type subunit 2
MIQDAAADMAAQANPDADSSGLLARYPKAATGAFDGDPTRLTEMDALIAYLQVLGRMVNFADYRTEDLMQ